MSRKFYIPVEVNNQTVSEETVAWYFPLLTGNQYLSKKVIKAYCSVNGLSKLFYEAGGGESGYKIKRLVFDYDYQANNTYPRTRPTILDTLRYAIEKTVSYNRYTSNDDFWLKLKNNEDEICDYVESLLDSSDNAVIVQTSFLSYYRIGITCYVGYSPATTIPVTGIGVTNAYKQIYYSTSGDGNSRIYIRVYMDDSGNLTKEYGTYSRNLGFRMGNDTSIYSSSYNYLSYVANIGVHFEEFNSGNTIANWDFTKSLYDTVDGVIGCRETYDGSQTTIDNTGLHLALYDACELPSWLMRYGDSIEIEFGNFTDIGGGTLIIFAYNAPALFYTSTDGWYLSAGTLKEPIGNYDADLFKNATFKFHYDSDNYISLYKNNTLIYTSSSVKMTEAAKTGSAMRVCPAIACDIKRMKIFNGIEYYKKATHGASAELTNNIVQPLYLESNSLNTVIKKYTSDRRHTETYIYSIGSSTSDVYWVVLRMWDNNHTYQSYYPIFISENTFTLNLTRYRDDVYQSDTTLTPSAKTRYNKTYYVCGTAGFTSLDIINFNVDMDRASECLIYNISSDISTWEAAYIVFDGTIS